jgi:carbon monoxide dehydrogenase subunit G
MELSGEFFVKADPDEAWRVLTDVERIAPCVPGVELREIDGEAYRGVMRVKVGQTTIEYRGSVSVLELDAEKHRAVLTIDGRETRGKGTAAATMTALLEDAGTGTKVSLTAEGTVSGKLGQLSTEELSDLYAELVSGFSTSLELLLAPSKASKRRAKGESARADAAASPSHNGTGTRRRRSAATTTPEGPQTAPATSSEGESEAEPKAAAVATQEAAAAASSAEPSPVFDARADSTGGVVEDARDDDAAVEDLAASSGGRALVARVAAVVTVAIALALIAAWLRRRLQ